MNPYPSAPAMNPLSAEGVRAMGVGVSPRTSPDALLPRNPADTPQVAKNGLAVRRTGPIPAATAEDCGRAISSHGWGSLGRGALRTCSLPVPGTSFQDRRCLALVKVHVGCDNTKRFVGGIQEIFSRSCDVLLFHSGNHRSTTSDMVGGTGSL